MRIGILSFVLLIVLWSCDQNKDQTGSESVKSGKPYVSNNRAKFEPANGECLLFAGQELRAVGGLEEWNQGYFNYFPHPAGWTMNTVLKPGNKAAAFNSAGLAGVKSTDEWGEGPSNISLQIEDEDFQYSALSIGLSLVNYEKAVADGELDYMIDSLGIWLKSLGQRPVFLRIGYEFGGEWNNYEKTSYIKAYKRIKDRYDKMGIDNVAYVWQSQGWGEDMNELQSWYPGDDYVDWCGTSFYNRWNEIKMFDFARKKKKPVFIAQATPTISTEDVTVTGRAKETRLGKKDQADEAWEKWFIPFFESIEENEDIVKAVTYINCNWKSLDRWKDHPTFQNIDARLHLNPEIAKKWLEKTSDSRFVHASPELWDNLWDK